MARASVITSTEIKTPANSDKVFFKKIAAAMASNGDVLKNIRNFVITTLKGRCKGFSKIIHSYGKDLHVTHGFLCIDDKVAIANAMKDPIFESFYMSHSGNWRMSDFD